jgi:hypothetical protein
MASEQSSAEAESETAKTNPEELQPGMLVVDRELAAEAQNEAIVMALPPIEAQQWDVAERDRTLAEDNPDYPADAQTTLVVFRSRFDDDDKYQVDVPDMIRRKLAAHEEIPIREIADLCKFYAFPAPRLEPTGEHWPSTQEAVDTTTESKDAADNGTVDSSTNADDSVTDLDRLVAVLDEAGFNNVEQHPDHVEATKLGETYRVDRTGTVIEGGTLAERLQTLVQKQYSTGNHSG